MTPDIPTKGENTVRPIYCLAITDTPKMLRETFCVAQTSIAALGNARTEEHALRLGRLIAECDRHRPLGGPQGTPRRATHADLRMRGQADLPAHRGGVMTRIDPDQPCQHEDFEAIVEVARLTDDDGNVEAYSASIRVTCRNCDERFRWIGAPAGLLPTQPCVSVDETELLAPLRPASGDPDFGLGIPGFAIRAREA